jgi:predicted RNA-binding Zn-ribbon protein involved in translation (DUF1610 family)
MVVDSARKLVTMYIRWTTYRCPSCNARWRSRIVTSPRVGRENRKCRSCGFVFRTPDKEWQHMTTGQRVGYFLNEWTVGLLAIYVIAALILYDSDKTDLQMPLLTLGVGTGCLFPFCLWKLFLVRQSIARTSSLLGQPASTRLPWS